MPSAKRTVRKGSTSGKAKPASSSKARTARTAPRKAAQKAAPARKPAPKAKAVPAKGPAKGPAKSPAKAARKSAHKTPAASKSVKAAKPALDKVTATKAMATKSKAPASREMLVRAIPGMVKTSGPRAAGAARKPTRRTVEVYDPNALIHGVRPYQTQNGETYMGPAQLDHFRKILKAWKRELMEEVDRTVHHMQDEASNFPDPNDRATQESEFGLELRTRDRERKLLKKIDSALERIEDGSYGYCEETGEEIGLKRLEARPVATLSLEAQERRELAERQYGERDDRYR